MTKYKWMRLKEVEDLTKTTLKKGDEFLYGSAVIGQKDTKNAGDQITYYKVIKSKGKSIEYQQVFDMLKED